MVVKIYNVIFWVRTQDYVERQPKKPRTKLKASTSVQLYSFYN